jgi:hypothetical protein
MFLGLAHLWYGQYGPTIMAVPLYIVADRRGGVARIWLTRPDILYFASPGIVIARLGRTAVAVECPLSHRSLIDSNGCSWPKALEST